MIVDELLDVCAVAITIDRDPVLPADFISALIGD